MKLAQARFMTILRFPFICLLITVHAQLVWAQTASEVTVSEEGSAWRIAVEGRMSAQVRQVWQALTDCAKARDFIPHFEACRIVEKDPAGRWDIRENISNPPFLPRNRTIIRSDYRAPHSFTYKLVSGDMRRSEGTWELIPQAGGTLLRYSALVEPLVAVPSFLIVPAIKNDVSDMFRRLDALSASRQRDQ
jgi:uncharacterized protein YndB with AHSA1/START domain